MTHGAFSEPDARAIMQQLLQALKYLHGQNIESPPRLVEPYRSSALPPHLASPAAGPVPTCSSRRCTGTSNLRIYSCTMPPMAYRFHRSAVRRRAQADHQLGRWVAALPTPATPGTGSHRAPHTLHCTPQVKIADFGLAKLTGSGKIAVHNPF